MIVAFAGRRIDKETAGDGEPGKFPLANVPRVRRDVEQFLADRRPAAVVGSAACGADLLVLEAAGRLGIRRRVVLPFERATFRARSVTDRSGNWGPLFDGVIAELAGGDLIELSFDASDSTAYAQATLEICRQCETLGSFHQPHEQCVALILWDGETRAKRDLTRVFLNEAERRGWPTVQIPTNGDSSQWP
jgi:hypothetical protein